MIMELALKISTDFCSGLYQWGVRGSRWKNFFVVHDKLGAVRLENSSAFGK